MSITASAIDTAINALVSEQQVNYSVGNKSFSNGDKIRQLTELRRHLQEIPEVELAFVQFDCDIGLSGNDETQTVVL